MFVKIVVPTALKMVIEEEEENVCHRNFVWGL